MSHALYIWRDILSMISTWSIISRSSNTLFSLLIYMYSYTWYQ